MATYILVEGPDGAGKSTLVKNLKEQFGDRAVCYHFGVPADHTKQYNLYADTILKHENTNAVVIFDRGWYSDRVYAPIMRHREEMSRKQAKELDKIVKVTGGGVILYCTADIDTLWDRCQQRGETYIENKEQLLLISKTYDFMLMFSELPVVKYDTSI